MARRTQRARRAQPEEINEVLREAEPSPEGDVEIQLDDDIMGDLDISIAEPPASPNPEARVAPQPRPAPQEDDAVARALEAQRRAEQLQADAIRQRDEAIRRAQEREQELSKERTDREDAEFNSILTAMAAEQANLEKAEADYAAASSVGDWGSAAKAQRAMAIAGGRLDRLEDGKRSFDARREAKAKEPERQQQPQPQAGDPVEAQIAALQIPEEGKNWLRNHRDYLTDPRKNRRLQSAHDDASDVAPIGTPKYIEALETALGLRQESQRQEEPAPQPQKRSIPMTAPVSREVPTASGTRKQSSMRLTEEERKIARDSIPDRPDLPKLTNAQKEYLYARNKAKYEQMKRDGTYDQQRQR